MRKNKIPYHRLQRPLDCAKLVTTRGIFIGSRILENTEGLNFEGSVLYKCYPSDLKGALEIEPSMMREELTSEGLDLRGVDFNEMNLSGLVFSGAILDSADFSHCELEGVDFSDASLYDAKFTCANLSDAKFINANLSDAVLEEANIKNTDFTGASLEDANFEDVKMFRTSIITTEQARSIGSGIAICEVCDANAHEYNISFSEDGKAYCEYCGTYCAECGELKAKNSMVYNAVDEYVCEDCSDDDD